MAAPLVLALTAVPAQAQTQAGGDSIRACYVPASGTIYRIKAPSAPSSCLASGHIEFGWGAGTTGVTAMANAGGGGGGGGGNTSDHGSLAGLADDDHQQYLLADGVRQATDGFAITGRPAYGTIPVSGAGIRMMWYAPKAAFRAGEAFQNLWDDANIGYGSTVLGLRSSAPGFGAAAIGLDSKAWGTGGFAAAGGTAGGIMASAMGADAEALGGRSTAVGAFAKATGDHAVAIGHGAKASGQRAMAFGGSSDASGEGAVAVGDRAHATGRWSAALGGVARATGYYSVALGLSEASGDYSTSIGRYSSTNGKKGSFVYGDDSSYDGVKASADNQFVVRAQRIWLGRTNNVTATANRFLETSTGAYLSTGGVWVSSSDSTKKHMWEAVDGEVVLSKLATLPIQTWNYRDEDASVRHMGPTAQEFRAAFQLGDTDRGIATVDADGVALAAAQALEQRTRSIQGRLASVEDLAEEVRALRAELEALRASIDESRQ